MIVSKKQSIEDIIVETLAKNPYTEGPALVQLINIIRPKTTKQAVYAALKLLQSSETVAKVGNKYFLSRVWLQKIYQLFRDQKQKEIVRDAIFDLNEKESISYHFPSLLSCDTYWAHVFNLLVEQIPKNCPTFLWNPHQIFIIGRTDIEKDIFTEFERQEKHGYFIIGGNTPLDKEFKRKWTNNYVSIDINDTRLFPNTYYLNVIGDFIIGVFFSKKLAEEIEKFYHTNHSLTPQKISAFENLLSSRCPIRMKISRKKTQAGVLRKKLCKNFFIPHNIKIK